MKIIYVITRALVECKQIAFTEMIPQTMGKFGSTKLALNMLNERLVTK